MTSRSPGDISPKASPRRRRRIRIRANSGRRPAPTAVLTAPLFAALALALTLTGPDFRLDLRHLLTNPNVALLLLLGGILFLYLEFNRPGAVLPAALGILLTTLALFGLSRLPLNPAAIVAVALALVLLLCEILLPLRNIAAAVAAAILAWGLARLVHNPAGLPTQHLPAQHLPVHPAIALLCAFVFIGATLALARVALRARRNKRIQTVTTPAPAPHPAR